MPQKTGANGSRFSRAAERASAATTDDGAAIIFSWGKQRRSHLTRSILKIRQARKPYNMHWCRRKSDVLDCQWIQTLHSYDLLESSFRPEADLVALRTLLRHRAQHILHMQKVLLQMNIQMLRDKVEYQPLSVEQYEANYRQQQVRYLQKKAAKLGFQLTPA